MKEKLRIGLLVDNVKISAWQYAMIERIVNSYYAEVDLILLNDGIRNIHKSEFDKLKKNRNQVFYHLLKRIDRRLSNVKPDAFAKKDLSALLPDTPVLKVKPVMKKFSDYFEKGDIDKVKDHKIDILIRMGFRVLRGEILKSSRYGVWSFHHGDNSQMRGSPPGFWEVVENWPTTGAVLQIISEDLDGGKVLYRSWTCTDKLSVAKNKNKNYWKSLTFLPRKIEELYNLGETEFFKKNNNNNKDLDLYSERLYKVPSNSETLKLAVNQLIKIFRHFIKNLFYQSQWTLMFDLNKDMSMSLFRFRKIIPPKDSSWSAPHVIKQNGKYYVFIEEFLNSSNKGHISVIEIDNNGSYGHSKKALEKNYHLSYPFVFESGEKIYMVPDSHDNRTIEIYECVDFPHKWEHKMNLMDNIDAANTTLFHHNKKWWLFTAIKEYEGAARDELYVFYANELLTTEWKAHPLNPVISDARKAIPAGKMFVRNEKIYRPVRDCSLYCGYGIRIQKITVLSEADYDERTISSAKPHWNREITGTHSFAYEEGLTVVDSLIRRPKLILGGRINGRGERI